MGGGEFAVGMGDESDAGDLEGVEEEEFSVTIGSGVEVRVSRELCCSNGEGFAERHGLVSAKSASFEDEDVSVGVGDGEGGAVLDCGDSFLVEEAAGLAEVLRSEGEAGLGPEGGNGHDLDLLT